MESVLAIAQALPEKVFPELKIGITSARFIKSSLLIIRKFEIELRDALNQSVIYARFPSDVQLNGGKFERFGTGYAVIAFGREGVTVWDQRIPTPLASFEVDGAYGISSVDHFWENGTLTSVVATTDGPIHELRDLRPVNRWRTQLSFVSDVSVIDRRVFALCENGRLPIVEIKDSTYVEILQADELIQQISEKPILETHFAERLVGERKHFGRLSRSITASDRFQNPRLSRVQIDGRQHLALHVQLDTHVTDELVLLFDLNYDCLKMVGQFLQPRKLLASHAIRCDLRDGRLTLIGALLSDFKLGYDLAIWAEGARTSRGIIFTPAGSTIRTKDDLTHVVFGRDDTCFAADASGGLFRFSLGDGAWEEIDRATGSAIVALGFHEH